MIAAKRGRLNWRPLFVMESRAAKPPGLLGHPSVYCRLDPLRNVVFEVRGNRTPLETTFHQVRSTGEGLGKRTAVIPYGSRIQPLALRS